MPIPIECQECHRSYKVDDKLAGKTVKCKGCAALIIVPGGTAPDNQCLSCGNPIPAGNRICLNCGFNLQTGQKESLLLGEDEGAIRARKNKRWIRKPGNPLLELLDRLVKVVAALIFLAGIAMTSVHIFNSPAGFSFEAVLPLLVMLGALIVIVVPLATLAVKQTVKALKLPPRDDTFTRLLACMLLPLTVSMIAGWPEFVDAAGWVAGLGWPLSVLLLLYLLRGDLLEWIASVIAALATAGLSLIVVSMLGSAINDIAGGLYADMLPKGPWTAMAKGHSPVPVVPPLTTLLASTAPATPGTPLASATATAPAPAGTEPVTTPTTPPTTIAAVTRPTPTTIASTTAPTAAPPRMTSPFFAAVIDNPDLVDSAAIIAPLAPADWMLTLKNTDTSTEIDRWSLNPLEKKEHHSYAYFAKKPAQFALSPHGDALAVLSFLPRRQLDVLAFDNKTPPRNVLLDVPTNVPNGATQATPVLLGVLDPAHYYLRWDFGGASALQMFNAPTLASGAPPWRWITVEPSSESSPPAISPNAHLTAVVGKNQLTFATTDGTPPPKPILIASDSGLRVLAVSFSPDSNTIAVLATVADLPTVMAFQVKTGTPVFTGLLSQTPVEKDAPIMPHALVWLGAPGSAQVCLVNGNDLVNADTGKKFASLGLTAVTDAQPLGPSLLALTFKNLDGTPHTILAKLDDDKIRAARNK